MNTIKQQLFLECQNVVNSKVQAIQHTIDGLHQSLWSETKSSAGDKHETGRAMVQLEREKAGQQLKVAEQLKQTLSKIDLSQFTDHVRLGSVVYTTHNNYFMAISAGKIQVKDQLFYAVSLDTPIGTLLFGKQVGDQIKFREQVLEIIKID